MSGNVRVYVKGVKSLGVVDSTDWLKTAAIIFVVIDHIGYFFMQEADWWNVVGRLAAPSFFFLLGYARTRTVPMRWIWLGVMLTLLDSANTDWTWVAPNILLSLALIRFARPGVQVFLQKYGWAALVIMVFVLIAALPITANVVEYGSEGWLWALFGLCQRMFVDERSATGEPGFTDHLAQTTHRMAQNTGLMRLVSCFAAAIVWVWQEQAEFSFPLVHFSVFVVGITLWSAYLCLFRRGTSRIQPIATLAKGLHFIGRHTLEIYTIQLASFEIIILLLPHLAA